MLFKKLIIVEIYINLAVNYVIGAVLKSSNREEIMVKTKPNQKINLDKLQTTLEKL